MRKNLLQFFRDGFSLANRSPEILLFSLFLSIASNPGLFISDPAIGDVITVLSLLLVFIYSAFTLCLPLFFVKKQQNKKVHFKEMAVTTLKTSKRIILPGIGVVLIFVVVLIVIGLVSLMLFKPSPEQVDQFLADSWGFPIFWVLISATMAVFEFTAFYFALENQGLFKALKSSFKAAMNNLNYILLIVLYILITCGMVFFIPFSIGPESLVNKVAQIAVAMVNAYLGLIISASSLYYYQKVLKKA